MSGAIQSNVGNPQVHNDGDQRNAPRGADAPAAFEAGQKNAHDIHDPKIRARCRTGGSRKGRPSATTMPSWSHVQSRILLSPHGARDISPRGVHRSTLSCSKRTRRCSRKKGGFKSMS